MRRVAFAVLGAGAFALGLILAGVGTWQLWAFAIAPDLTFLPGLGRTRPGQLHPRAVPFYNAAHRLWVPLALGAGLAALTELGIVPRAAAAGWLAGACAWVAHIGTDNALGFGLRERNGFQRAA